MASPFSAQDKIIAPGASDAQIDEFFKPFDTNNDRVISYDEFSVKQSNRFTKLDTDKNGQVTPRGIYRSRSRPNPTKLASETSKFAQPRQGPGRQSDAGGIRKAPRTHQQFDEMDANCDGEMSLAGVRCHRAQQAAGEEPAEDPAPIACTPGAGGAAAVRAGGSRRRQAGNCRRARRKVIEARAQSFPFLNSGSPPLFIEAAPTGRGRRNRARRLPALAGATKNPASPTQFCS